MTWGLVLPGESAINAKRVPGTGSAAGFTEWLRRQLKARKMSQRQLALRSGVDHSSISRLMRGQRMPSLETAMKLARGMDPLDVHPVGGMGQAEPSRNPAAVVEYALRADDQLNEDDVRDVMLRYLAARRRRIPTTSNPPGGGRDVRRRAGQGRS